MTGKRVWKIIFILVIIAGLALGGMALYRAGFIHGAMTNITLPEGSDFPVRPYSYIPYGPRVGLLGLFPFLCFGGFFFLLMFFGFGFCARRRAWMHYGPGARHRWNHHGPPPRDQEGSDSEPPTPSDEAHE